MFKSELAALAQQHFAPGMNARHLVGWHSIGNSLEAMAFAAKDSLLVIDDCAPAVLRRMCSGSARSGPRDPGAGQSIRARAPSSGWHATSDQAAPVHDPSTGEDVPTGQSIRARLFIVEVAAGDVNQARLTELQAHAEAGAFAGAMAAFISWLAVDSRSTANGSGGAAELRKKF